MYNVVLVRYGEIGLKGRNRPALKRDWCGPSGALWSTSPM